MADKFQRQLASEQPDEGEATSTQLLKKIRHLEDRVMADRESRLAREALLKLLNAQVAEQRGRAERAERELRATTPVFNAQTREVRDLRGKLTEMERRHSMGPHASSGGDQSLVKRLHAELQGIVKEKTELQDYAVKVYEKLRMLEDQVGVSESDQTVAPPGYNKAGTGDLFAL
mmetsp:Transcript_31678/g.68460  ORF Transcript_31678/g.68460 Transcript_31678/m.68460 type:complete len:174 (-) Transcript_31678:223-744(-)